MAENEGILVTFLDQTGAKSPTVTTPVNAPTPNPPPNVAAIPAASPGTTMSRLFFAGSLKLAYFASLVHT